MQLLKGDTNFESFKIHRGVLASVVHCSYTVNVVTDATSATGFSFT